MILLNRARAFAQSASQHRFLRGAGMLVAAQYLAAAIGLLTGVYAARTLGSATYGVAALTIAYPSFILSCVSLKSETLITRYLAAPLAESNFEDVRAFCKLGYAIDMSGGIASVILVGVTAPLVSRAVYQLPEISWMIVGYAAFSPLTSLAGTSWAILLAWRKYHWLAAFQILAQALPLVLVVSLLARGVGAAGLVFGIAAGKAAVGFAMFWACTFLIRRDTKASWWKGDLRHVTGLRRELVSFAGWNHLSVTLSGLITQIPVMLLGRFQGPEQAGYYRLAATFTTAASYIESSLSRMVYPTLAAKRAPDRPVLRDLVRQWTVRGGVPASIIVLLSVPAIPVIVRFVFGESYAPMARGAQIMMVAVAASVAFFWQAPFYFVSGRIASWTKGTAVYTATTVVIGVFCSKYWGFWGMAALFAITKTAFIFGMLGLLWSQSKSATYAPAQ